MRNKVLLIIAFCGFMTLCHGQQGSAWNKWNWLMGEWSGESDGQTGRGGGTFSLNPGLDNKILIRKNHAEYPATDNKPQIIHEDLMIVYLDPTGNPSNAVYFDNEGHTINYAIAYPNKSIVLTSDKTKNAPVFRVTYELIDNQSIKVKFEMSQDGETFLTYTEGKCKRTGKSGEQ